MTTPLRGRRAAPTATNRNGNGVASLLNNNGINAAVAVGMPSLQRAPSIQNGGTLPSTGAAAIAIVGTSKRSSIAAAGGLDLTTSNTAPSNNNTLGPGVAPTGRMSSLPPPRAPRPRPGGVLRSQTQLETTMGMAIGGAISGGSRQQASAPSPANSSGTGSGENSKAHSRQQSSASAGDGELKEWSTMSAAGRPGSGKNGISVVGSNVTSSGARQSSPNVVISAAEKQLHDQLDTAIAALQVRSRPLAVQVRHMSAITPAGLMDKPPPHLRAASTISVTGQHTHTSLAVGGGLTVGSSASVLTPQRLTPSRSKDTSSASAPSIGIATSSGSSAPAVQTPTSASSSSNHYNNNTNNSNMNNPSTPPVSYTPPPSAPTPIIGIPSFGLAIGGSNGNGEKRTIPRLNFSDIPAQPPSPSPPPGPTAPAPVATVYSYSAQGQPTIVATGEARQAVIARAESPSALQWKQHVAAEEAAAAAAAAALAIDNDNGSNSRPATPPLTARRASSANPDRRASMDPSLATSLMSSPPARGNRKSGKNLNIKPPTGNNIAVPGSGTSSSTTPNSSAARGSTFNFNALPSLSTTTGQRMSVSSGGLIERSSSVTGSGTPSSSSSGMPIGMSSPSTPAARAGGWLPADSPASRQKRQDASRESQSRGRRGQFSSVVRLDDSIDGLTATVAGALARASGAAGGGTIGDRYGGISISGNQVGVERERGVGGGNTVMIGGRRGDYELQPINMNGNGMEAPSPSHGRRARPNLGNDDDRTTTMSGNGSNIMNANNGARVPSAGRNGSFGGANGTPQGSATPLDGEVAAVNNARTNSGNDWVLDVGVAMDPNPRYRPTMEDAHVVIIGFGQTTPNDSRTSPAQRNVSLASGRRRATNTMVTRKASIVDDVKIPPAKQQSVLRAGGAAVAGSGASAGNNNNNNSGGVASALSPPAANGPVSTTPAGGFFAIFDGHGGRACVDFVEKTLHRELEKALATAPVQRAIEMAFLETDNQMAKASKYQECGSTACVAYIRPTPNGGRELYVANVGDAQAVLATSTTAASPPGSPLPQSASSMSVTAAAAAAAAQSLAGLSMFSSIPSSSTSSSLSVNSSSSSNGGYSNVTPRPIGVNTNNSNHSPSSSPSSSSSSTPKKVSSSPTWLVDPHAPKLKAVRASYAHVASDPREQTRVKQAGGRIFMGRVNGSLAVSRALGDHGLKKSGVTAVPYQMRIPLTADVKFVIIGCDGVWDVMNEKVITPPPSRDLILNPI
jgi:serine/threonine protein phosphatase PrpC